MSVSVTCLGAARNVTGSRHLIEADGVRVLVDCGMYQEREYLARNWEPFPVPPESIDAVLLTHAHLDHTGYLPRLVAQGFAGKVYATPATAGILPVVLEDSAHLQAEDARFKAKRHRREGRKSPRPPEPLYDADDVGQAVRRLHAVSFSQTIKVARGVTARFLPSGHILGAGIVLVEAGGRRILFSGDLGRAHRPLLPDPAPPPEADLVVMESTYGDRHHDSKQDVEAELADTISDTARQGGALLIPCFAVERSQDLLYYLNRIYRAGRAPSLPVFLDSPMAIKLLDVYRRHSEAMNAESRDRLARDKSLFDLPQLKLCLTSDESKAVNYHRDPCIVIAGSGMCSGGRIKHHLAQHIHRPESTVLFVGYQASGTLGRQLVEGARRIRLFGGTWNVHLSVQQIHGFSGHADQEELLAWLGRMRRRPGQVAVVHGGSNIAPAFAALVEERLGVAAHAPTYLERIQVR